MPTSDIDTIGPLLRAVEGLNPRSVLDLGIGFGKYGALLREYLDMRHGRIPRSEWGVRIVGVEGFETYKNPMHEMYDCVYYGDFVSVILGETQSIFRGHDLVMLIDSLEHLDEDLAQAVLNVVRKNNRHVLVSCPNGDYPQGAEFGNDFEIHRSAWTAEKLMDAGGHLIFRAFCSLVYFKGEV